MLLIETPWNATLMANFWGEADIAIWSALRAGRAPDPTYDGDNSERDATTLRRLFSDQLVSALSPDFSSRQAVPGEASAGMDLVDKDALFYSRIFVHYPFYFIDACVKDSNP